jgi:glutathione S-transferase
LPELAPVNPAPLELLLAAARAEIARARTETARFCSVAGHDMRQPLQALRLFVYILQTRGDQPPDPEVLAKMDNSLDAIEALLKRLREEHPIPAAGQPPVVLADAMGAAAARLAGVSVSVPALPGTAAADPTLLAGLFDTLLKLAAADPAAVVTVLPLADEAGGHGLAIRVRRPSAERLAALGADLAATSAGDPGAVLGRGLAAAGYLAKLTGFSLALETGEHTMDFVLRPSQPQRSTKESSPPSAVR